MLFVSQVQLAEFPARKMDVRSAAVLFREVRRSVREYEPAVVHLHSSFAGAVGRLAMQSIRSINKTFYSPHGFAFLRKDVSATRRKFFALVERCLHLVGGTMVLVSQSERQAAFKALSPHRLYVLENAVDVSALPETPERGEHIMVGTAGRVTYAKAPWKFAALADSLAGSADFIWVGGGIEQEVGAWLSTEVVNVTGWQSEEDAVRYIASLDIYVSTSLWEGMPLAVLQAQALGIPCVVSNCVGNIDIVQHGETGYIASTEAQLRSYIVELIEDKALRERLGARAKDYARERFNSQNLGPKSFDLYWSVQEKTKAGNGVPGS
jgi:glycosyltransferase involved in cell wall biosynthesis